MPHRRAQAVLVLCGVVLAAAALRVAVHDPTDEPVSGDQASFTYQALSLLGGDLAYDASDQARWEDLGWADQPHGLFLQRRADGWAFAKPLGYSVLLAPAIGVAGARGISLVGAALVLAYAACWYGLGRSRWDRATAAAVATVATVASHAWLFGFPAHADLFVAVLVGIATIGAVRAAGVGTLGRAELDAGHTAGSAAPGGVALGAGQTADSAAPGGTALGGRAGRWSATTWLALAAAASGLLVTEKLPALVALAPLLVVAFLRAGRRAQVVAVVVGVVVVAASVAPYLYYSDGASWSAYGGDRYYAIATTPWSGGTEADLTPWQTRDSLSPSAVLDAVRDPSSDLPSAALTYAVGRHTGVATFQPIVAALALAGAAGAVARRRGASRVDGGDRAGALAAGGSGTDPPVTEPAVPAGGSATDPTPNEPQAPEARHGDRALALAALGGLLAYAGLYLVTFTDNYFGGGQSIGNRYFLQVSALVPVAAAAVSARAARWCAAVAAVAAVGLLAPQLRHPESAFFRIDRTSALQRLLPFDGSQVHAWRFQCEPAECVPPPLEAYDG